MRKSQAEIFGIALVFVVLILGVILYSQWNVLHESEELQDIRKEKYDKLAVSSLESALATDTDCDITRYQNSFENLIKYCLTHWETTSRPQINCGGHTEYACTYSLDLLNKTLNGFFNSSEFVNLPFIFNIEVPRNSNHPLNNKTLTNFGNVKYRGNKVNKTNLYNYGFTNKATNGKYVIESTEGSIIFYLEIYYR